jgi:hypothetical protein
LCREFAENDKDKSLRPGDAIHIAAAERAGCDVIFSYDSGFLKLKYTKIPIGIPEGIPMLPGTGMESGKLDFGEPEKV